MGFFSKMVNSALVNVAKATNPPGAIMEHDEW